MSIFHRLHRRARTVLNFARAGQSAADWPALALAGFSRARPFGDSSLYSRVGRLLGREVTPQVATAHGLRVPLSLIESSETTVFEEIFVEHIYPLETVPFTPDLVVDCGAFCGMFSLLAHAKFPFARKIAFEPEKTNAERCRHAIAVNRVPITLHEAAVGVADGQGHFTGSSFGGKVSDDDHGSAVNIMSLPRMLREFAPRRLVLKIDIEGAERELLPALVDCLPDETVIFLETHYAEEENQRFLRPLLDAGFADRVIRTRHEDQIYIERVLIRARPLRRHFCSALDRNTASQGLALAASLRRHAPNFKLWVLCLDDETALNLRSLGDENLELVTLAELEAADPELARTKSTRSSLEYGLTCAPCLALHILRRDPSVDLITHLEPDVWFVQSPELIFDEIGTRSVAIVPHRFSPGLERLAENGRYNTGWITFRRSTAGLACLESWRAQCIDWCYLRHEPGRYAAQKYLDQWTACFAEVCEVQHHGANLGLWNLRGQRVTQHLHALTVDDAPLVFFHFHDLRRPRPWLFCLPPPVHGERLTPSLSKLLLEPYADEVSRIEDRRQLQPANETQLESDRFSGWLTQLRFVPHAITQIVAGHYVVARHHTAPWWI